MYVNTITIRKVFEMCVENENEFLLRGMLGCLRVWLRLFFKKFFTRKCIKIIFFFYFLKIIFNISKSIFKNTKKYINLK